MKSLLLFPLILMSVSAHADLGLRFESERSLPSAEVRAEVTRLLRDVQVVFVGSRETLFRAHRGFRDNAKELRGLSHEPKFIATGFFESYEINTGWLLWELQRVHSESGKPLVVIGNPQSGPDVLYAMLREPRLLPLIDKLVLLTPAFGTPLVDAFDTVEPEVADFIRDYLGGNLRKFRADLTVAMFDQAVKAAGEPHAGEVSRRTYWVRGAAPSARSVPLMLQLPYRVMSMLGPNDSISLADRQRLRSLEGRDLGVLAVDHFDLWVTRPVSNSPASDRHAFMRALVMELYHPTRRP